MKKLKKAEATTLDIVNMDCLGPDVFRIFENQLPAYKRKNYSNYPAVGQTISGRLMSGLSALFK